MGPTTISPARFDYNQAIAASWNEQLLLNLVRLRYRDTMHFLEVSSVITQYTLEQQASASAGALFNGSTVGDVALGAGVTFSEEPTVTFTPMNDATFAQRLLAPIPAETLIQLAQSGWSTEQLMLCTVPGYAARKPSELP